MTESEKESVKSWLGKNEVGKKINKTIFYTDENGNGVEVDLQVSVLSGKDKETAEELLFSDGTGNVSLTRYKREVIRLSLGLTPKEIDEMYRNKPSTVIEKVEEACLTVNSGRFARSKSEVDELKKEEGAVHGE